MLVFSRPLKMDCFAALATTTQSLAMTTQSLTMTTSSLELTRILVIANEVKQSMLVFSQPLKMDCFAALAKTTQSLAMPTKSLTVTTSSLTLATSSLAMTTQSLTVMTSILTLMTSSLTMTTSSLELSRIFVIANEVKQSMLVFSQPLKMDYFAALAMTTRNKTNKTRT